MSHSCSQTSLHTAVLLGGVADTNQFECVTVEKWTDNISYTSYRVHLESLTELQLRLHYRSETKFAIPVNSSQ